MKSIPQTLLCLSLLLSCCSLSAQEFASAEIRLDISSQPLESALKEFGAQTGLQVLFPSDQVRMRQSVSDVVGFQTPRKALDLLLAGTDLKYEFRTEVGFVSDRIEEYSKKNPFSFLVMDRNMCTKSKDTFEELMENLNVPLIIIPNN